jgi:RNA-binding protein YlmH
MDKDSITINKLIEKANKAYNIHYQVHSDFLDLHEQSLLYSHRSELPLVDYSLFGGFSESERKCAVFYPVETEKDSLIMPYTMMKITPVNSQQSKSPNHRDYLGSLLGLSIKRDKIGDILIKDNCAYMCCIDTMADFIMNNLLKVKNTTVTIERVDEKNVQHINLDYRVLSNTVASNRIDGILKICLSLSRTKVVELIRSKKVFVNSQIVENTSTKIIEGTVISVRGYGKYKLYKIGNETKKGRFHVEIYQYI